MRCCLEGRLLGSLGGKSAELKQIGCECEGDREGILVWVPPEANPEARIQVQIVNF